MKAATITIDGKVIGFVARKGCRFELARSHHCMLASDLAMAAGQPDCEDDSNGFIYVEADPRQLVLDDEVLP